MKDKGGYLIKKLILFATLMASITTFSISKIPINVKGVLGMKIETNPLLPLISLDGEIEARAYDIKFTNIISMENNIGISTSINANLPSKNNFMTTSTDNMDNGDIKAFSSIGLEALAYYQPSVKFRVLKDLSLKAGLKLGVGATLLFRTNSHVYFGGIYPTVVTSFVAGAEYKNIIVETELAVDTRLQDNDIATAELSTNSTSPKFQKIIIDKIVPDFKIKVGYRF